MGFQHRAFPNDSICRPICSPKFPSVVQQKLAGKIRHPSNQHQPCQIEGWNTTFLLKNLQISNSQGLCELEGYSTSVPWFPDLYFPGFPLNFLHQRYQTPEPPDVHQAMCTGNGLGVSSGESFSFLAVSENGDSPNGFIGTIYD